MARRIILRLVVYVLFFLGGIVLIQDRLLYFPDTLAQANLLAEVQRDGLLAWPATGELRGLRREPAGHVRATLLLFHGNAGHVGHRAYYADLARLGLRVILAEYPGYGPRSGKPGEEILVADAVETIRLARREFAGPLLLAGESLGSGVAAAAYARVPDAVAAVLLITPWDSLTNVASHHYPWLPVRWMLRDRYDSIVHLASAQVPVAVLVAERDSVVPARYGENLYDSLRAPKRAWRLAGAGHNDWMDHIPPRWWEDAVDFLLPPLVTKQMP
jgi:pimeloyl-ACP methyl ester carboxylesterase